MSGFANTNVKLIPRGLSTGGATLLLLSVAIFVAVIWWWLGSGTMRIAISEQQILERLGKKLPRTETYLYAFDVTYDSPRVALVEASKRIRAGLDVSVRINFLNDAEPLRGKIDAAAGVRYSATEAAFYLTDPVIEALTLDGLPDQWANKARDVVADGVRAYFKDHPIYRLKDREAHRAAKAVLQTVTIKQGRLILHLGPQKTIADSNTP